MEPKLLLTSQGIPEELKEEFFSCLNKPPAENSVAFITTAAYGEDKAPTWLQYYKQQLQNYGIREIEEIDLKDYAQKELQHMLSTKDIIFVNGGNTFYLLHWARKSGFTHIIKNLLNAGKIYIGVSAGSYIACPTIEQATWKHQDRNRIGITDFTALNLVPFLISAHFKEEYRPIVEQAAKNTQYPIIALNDTQAIIVEGKHWKIVGQGEKMVFNLS